MKLIEAHADELVSDAESKRISKMLGIIDDEDCGYFSPEKKASKKFDHKNEEANK